MERSAHLSSYIHFFGFSRNMLLFYRTHHKTISQYLSDTPRPTNHPTVIHTYVQPQNNRIEEEMLEPQFNILHIQFILVDSRYSRVLLSMYLHFINTARWNTAERYAITFHAAFNYGKLMSTARAGSEQSRHVMLKRVNFKHQHLRKPANS